MNRVRQQAFPVTRNSSDEAAINAWADAGSGRHRYEGGPRLQSAAHHTKQGRSHTTFMHARNSDCLRVRETLLPAKSSPLHGTESSQLPRRKCAYLADSQRP